MKPGKQPSPRRATRAVSGPKMKKVAAALVRKYFSETIDAVRISRERLIIVRHGYGLAAIVPVEDAELLAELVAADDVRVAGRRLRAIREGRESTIAAADLYKKLGL
jgi:PHD/YefM family antitoxin component YafN of YafNO toxin-antitoxin module